MMSNKIIKICSGLLLAIAIIISLTNKSLTNNKFMPIAITCLGIFNILDGVLEYRKRNYILGTFSFLVGIGMCMLTCSDIIRWQLEGSGL